MNFFRFRTLRFKLLGIYLLTIVTPFIILAFALPYFTQTLIKRDTEHLTAGTVNSLARNLETYLDDLDRLTTSPYLNDEIIRALKLKASGKYDKSDAYTRLQTDRALSVTLPKYLINTRSDILNTITISNNGSVYMTSKQQAGLVPDFPFQDQIWYKKAVAANGKSTFINAHSQDYLSNHDQGLQVFSVAREIRNPDSGQPLAVILADADTVVLEKITRDVSFNVSSTIAVLDENRSVVYANHPISLDLRAQLADARDLNRLDNDAYVTVSKKLAPSNWSIVVLLSNNELKAKVRWIYLVAILLSIGGLFVTFLMFHYFSQWIIKPFKRMNAVMREVKNGNLHARFTASGPDEIGQLGESFNRMIGQLDELIIREYKAVLAQRNAEYRALQSQIQPHFLYNTLNGFIGLNRAGQKEKLETAVLSLSGMLRYILEGGEHASLQEEFDFLRKYGMLQQLRFDERLAMAFSLDPQIADYRIPKLLLQPLVENAIIHGAEPSDETCRVTVSAAPKLGPDGSIEAIRICIEDDGVGFDEQASDARQPIGIANVQSRLAMTDERAIMTVDSSPGRGTRVELNIPIPQKESYT